MTGHTLAAYAPDMWCFGRTGGRAFRRKSAEWNLMMVNAAAVQAIYRYPVKGLSPQALPSTHLGVGATLPGDRLYAIENGPSGFDPKQPKYQPKIRYLMLMRNERLALLKTRYEEASRT